MARQISLNKKATVQYKTGGMVNPNPNATVTPTKLAKNATGTGGYPCANKADHAKFVNQ